MKKIKVKFFGILYEQRASRSALFNVPLISSFFLLIVWFFVQQIHAHWSV